MSDDLMMTFMVKRNERNLKDALTYHSLIYNSYFVYFMRSSNAAQTLLLVLSSLPVFFMCVDITTEIMLTFCELLKVQ